MKLNLLNILFFTFSLNFSLPVFSQKDHLVFKKLGAEDGLGNNSVTTIIKDSKGFMWFGNESGLHRYDSYVLKTFKHSNADTNSIASNKIWSIAEDANGNIWLATAEGLDKLIVEEGRFVHVLKDIDAYHLLIDSRNILWIGCGKGLARLNLTTNDYYLYKHVPGDSNSIGPNGIMSLALDDDKNLWLSSWGYGITKLDVNKNKFTHYLHNPKDPNSIFEHPVFTIITQGKYVWAGTLMGNRLARLNTTTGKFSFFTPDKNCQTIMVYKSSKDRDGNLWFSSLDKGLIKYEPLNEKFFFFVNGQNFMQDLSEGRLNTLYCDNDGMIWASTLNKGLNYAKLYNKDALIYNFGRFTGNIKLFDIIINNSKQLYVLYSGGVLKYDEKLLEFKEYLDFNIPEHFELFTKIESENVFTIMTEKDSIVVDLSKKNYTFYKPVAFKYGVFTYNLIIKDPALKVWVKDTNMYYSDKGFEEGKIIFSNDLLREFNYYLGKKVRYNYNGKNEHLIFFKGNVLTINQKGDVKHLIKNITNSGSNNAISAIYPKGDTLELIIGNEIIYYNIKTGKKRIKNVYCIKNEDIIPYVFKFEGNKYCFLTNRGIIFYDLNSSTYTKPFIFSNNRVNPDDAKLLPNGNIMLESTSGILEFNPMAFFKIENPRFSITDFYLFNQQVAIGGKSPLKKDPSYLKEITLTHKDFVFSFEFSQLNYWEDKKSYRYMLEGYETGWNYVGQRKVATYTSLPPGTYNFVAQGWAEYFGYNEQASIKIIIEPAYWQTWWFKVLIVLLIVVIVYAFFYFRLKSIKRQKEKLEMEVMLRTKEIVEKNNEIVAQNEEITAQNEEIGSQRERLAEVYQEVTDNIITAKRIQEAVLPLSSIIAKEIPDHFIFYKPKDIVSGDFYWYYQKFDKVYIAAVDCTGHGVSGAFMSLIGRSLLDKIVLENPTYSPAEILDELSVSLVKTLHQDQEDSITKEGMDIALCIIDKEEEILQFAGANNPLIIRKETELEVIKGSPFGIGLMKGKPATGFVNNIIPMQKGDAYYIFSDGFVSQFGGESGEEKLKISRFKEIIQNLPVDNFVSQNQTLEKALDTWQGSTPQTDDILVIGFKLS